MYLSRSLYCIFCQESYANIFSFIVDFISIVLNTSFLFCIQQDNASLIKLHVVQTALKGNMGTNSLISE